MYVIRYTVRLHGETVNYYRVSRARGLGDFVFVFMETISNVRLPSVIARVYLGIRFFCCRDIFFNVFAVSHYRSRRPPRFFSLRLFFFFSLFVIFRHVPADNRGGEVVARSV